MQRHSTSKEHSGAKAGRALPVWDSPSRVLFPGGLISWCQLPFAAPLTRGHQQFCAHIRKNIWWLEIKMIFLVSSCVSTKAAIYPWVYFPLQATGKFSGASKLLHICVSGSRGMCKVKETGVSSEKVSRKEASWGCPENKANREGENCSLHTKLENDLF